MDIKFIDNNLIDNNLNIIIELFNILNLKITNYNDLFSLSITQNILKEKNVINTYYNLIPKIKKHYKSHKLTCLHKNSLDKQKFPAVNFLRQILKINKLKLKSNIKQKYINKNYKMYTIYYTIESLKNTNIISNNETYSKDLNETQSENSIESLSDINSNQISKNNDKIVENTSNYIHKMKNIYILKPFKLKI